MAPGPGPAAETFDEYMARCPRDHRSRLGVLLPSVDLRVHEMPAVRLVRFFTALMTLLGWLEQRHGLAVDAALVRRYCDLKVLSDAVDFAVVSDADGALSVIGAGDLSEFRTAAYRMRMYLIALRGWRVPDGPLRAGGRQIATGTAGRPAFAIAAEQHRQVAGWVLRDLDEKRKRGDDGVVAIVDS